MLTQNMEVNKYSHYNVSKLRRYFWPTLCNPTKDITSTSLAFDMTQIWMNVWICYKHAIKSVYYLGLLRLCKSGNKNPNTSGVEWIYLKHSCTQADNQNKKRRREEEADEPTWLDKIWLNTYSQAKISHIHAISIVSVVHTNADVKTVKQIIDKVKMWLKQDEQAGLSRS